MARRMVPYLIGVLFLAPASVHAGEAKPAGEKYAFLVGCGHYAAGLIPDLDCTVEDVTDFAAALRQTGWSDDHIVLMHDRGPTRFQPEKKKILKELERQLSGLKPDDFAVVALSGHGMRLSDDDHGYFCPTDARPDDKDSLLSLTDVYDLLSACPARRKFLVVNACRCDSLPGPGLLGLENLFQKREDVPKDVAVLFSCAAGQPSWGDGHLGHSVFFHYLIQAWEGDANPKGAVTLDDLVGYVRRETKDYVRTKMKADQAPVFTGEGAGSWVLAEGGWAADAEAKAVAVVERLGGTVTRDEGRPGKPVVEVHLGFSQTADADLKELAPLKRLQVLALPNTPVTDAGLKNLDALPGLRKLYLNDTGVTDAGMKEVARLQGLAGVVPRRDRSNGRRTEGPDLPERTGGAQGAFHRRDSRWRPGAEGRPACPRHRLLTGRSILSRNDPARVVRGHADVRVVFARRGRRQQNQRGVQPRRLLSAADQLAADALPLMRLVHGQIGKICAVGVIGERPRDADQPTVEPGRHDQVGVGQHGADGLGVPHRAALGERGSE